ncbi:MAG TPA: glycosyl hydrolase family 39 [Edaphobacter sp.]|nr:glycosyl hydrolase family 39 [Edaphobacter sp.]
MKWFLSGFVIALTCFCAAGAQGTAKPDEVKVDWAKVIRVSQSTPTLQVVVNPQLLRGARLHDGSFAALHMLGADYVRYVPWLPYPRQAVAELSAPAQGKTSWDFTHIDPTLDDFMKATEGHSVIMNFSTIPAWMYKTEKPVTFPDDPNQVFWNYTQGTELRDPSMKEISAYFARLLSWYTQGGFTDEYGKRWESGHHYKIPYWEVLNEIEFEHHWTPQEYTKFYDSVTAAMRKVDPNIKFVGLALAAPSKHPEMFEYFLNPANHRKGAPLDFISYHFYATPSPDQNLDDWQYTFFDQAEGFLNTVRYVEEIRKRLSPSTKTDLDELGVILPEDGKEIRQPGYVAKPEPQGYWNLDGAMYAYIYEEAAKIGIDVLGESQLVGYPSQYPSVSMMNYNTAEPNPRFWILKLLKDNFGPGDKLADTTNPNGSLSVQAFETRHGKSLLVINKRNRAEQITLPADADGAAVSLVAPSTGDHAPAQETLHGRILSLQPFEVAVLQYK